jgi:hypothetical protein
MKINEITEEIVTRQSIIDAMVAKNWPRQLQKEFGTEALFDPPFSDGLNFVNGLDLEPDTPQMVSNQALLQNKENQGIIAMVPPEVVDIINKKWGTRFQSNPAQQHDTKPERYMQYAKMTASTALPSTIVDGEIIYGNGRFIAALLRGDKQLKVWNLKRNSNSTLNVKATI